LLLKKTVLVRTLLGLFIVINSLYGENVWRDFNYNYTKETYSLRKDIDYFELRGYLFYQNYLSNSKETKLVSHKYIKGVEFGRKKLSDYSRKMISKFQNTSYQTDRFPLNSYPVDFKVGWLLDYSIKNQGFLIKTDETIWTINELKDFFWLFDKIDSEAELYFILHLMVLDKNPYTKVKYREIQDGYEVQVKPFFYPSFDGEVHYISHETDIYTIKKDGNVSKKVVEKGRTILSQAPVEADPAWAFGIGVPKKPKNIEQWIYEKKSFITPMKEFYIF